MTPPPASTTKGSPHFGDITVISLLISVLVLLIAYIAIRPRFSQGRLSVDQLSDLTAEEVSLLPAGTLPVVLGRGLAGDKDSFKIQLLRLVMQRSGVPHAIGFSASPIAQDAAVDALASGASSGTQNPQAITVGVYGAGPELNQRLRAIPIPISGGLLGLRVGWTHSESLAKLSAVQNLADLRRVTLLQGQGWSELGLFDHSVLRTYAAPPQYLFRLVAEQRVELFPQGIGDLQVQQPTAAKWSSNIEIEPHLLIAYPFAGFFYVNPDNDALAEAIALGFERAIADGSYQALLERRVMTPWLKQNLSLRERQVIFVPNPNVGDGLEDVEPRHWLVPWQRLASGEIQTGEQMCAQSGFKPLCD